MDKDGFDLVLTIVLTWVCEEGWKYVVGGLIMEILTFMFLLIVV